MWDYITTRFARDPDSYIKTTGKSRSKSYELQAVGSAFVLTPDGVLGTAAHVVTADDATKEQFASMAAEEFSTADMTSLELEELDLSDEAITAMQKAVATYNSTHVKVSMKAPKVEVLMGVAANGGTREGKPVPATVLASSAQDSGEDTALLRIRGYENLPTVAMGDSNTMAVGSKVYVSGFPADATYIQGMSEAATLQPTISAGTITATKTTESGVPLLQTDAKASPGSSGGACLDESGAVIGVLVSGAIDDRGVSVGQQFCQQGQVLQDQLRANNVTPATSVTTTKYNTALEDYFNHYYKRALPLFREVKDLFPSHAYADRYISDSQTAITAGQDETPSSSSLPLILGGAAAALLVVLGAVLAVVLRRRRKRAAAAAQQVFPVGAPGAGYAEAPAGGYGPAAQGAPVYAAGQHPAMPAQGQFPQQPQGPYAPAYPAAPVADGYPHATAPQGDHPTAPVPAQPAHQDRPHVPAPFQPLGHEYPPAPTPAPAPQVPAQPAYDASAQPEHPAAPFGFGPRSQGVRDL
nr:serine protease [Motilibacter deserti]